MLHGRIKMWCLAILCFMFIGCGDLDKKETAESTGINEAVSMEEEQQKLYNQAMELYEKGDYEHAIDIFYSVIDITDSKNMIKKCKYGLAVDYFEAEQYVEAFDLFVELNVYEDAKALANQCISIAADKIFDNAKLLLKNGDAQRALEHFRWINNNKSKVECKLENLSLCISCAYDMCKLSNAYYEKKGSGEKCIEIDGTDVYVYSSFPVIDKGNYKIVDFKSFNYGVPIPIDGFVLNNGIIIYYELANDGSIWVIDIENQVDQSFISADQVEFLAQQQKVKDNQEKKIDPYIGMSEDELKESSWGIPKNINKTTYAWGVYEQWCYSGYRYVYLEDGIVVTIQE